MNFSEKLSERIRKDGMINMDNKTSDEFGRETSRQDCLSESEELQWLKQENRNLNKGMFVWVLQKGFDETIQGRFCFRFCFRNSGTVMVRV